MNRLIGICAAMALSCVGSAFVSAQGRFEVKGTVVDGQGPVAGVSVVELGTSNGTSTDLDGRFTLMVASQLSEVEISCIGYVSQIWEAASLPRTVVMETDSEFLDELVVIGYGKVRKDDLTGSVSAIKAEDMNRGAVVNTQDMLKGKVPGLLITPGDGGPGSNSHQDQRLCLSECLQRPSHRN